MTTPANRQIHHVGYVVDDLASAVDWAARTLGAGPFFVIEHLQFDEFAFKGKPAVYDHSSAFGQWGDIKLELTVAHSASPSELYELVGNGAPRLGHIAFLADDLERESARFEAVGMERVTSGSSGPVVANWHDARSSLGHMIEILQRGPEIEGFYELIRSAADGWDGTEPFRQVPDGG